MKDYTHKKIDINNLLPQTLIRVLYEQTRELTHDFLDYV